MGLGEFESFINPDDSLSREANITVSTSRVSGFSVTEKQRNTALLKQSRTKGEAPPVRVGESKLLEALLPGVC